MVHLVEWAIAMHGMYESPVALVIFIFYVVFNWKKLVMCTHTNNRFLCWYFFRCVSRIWLHSSWKISSNLVLLQFSSKFVLQLKLNTMFGPRFRHPCTLPNLLIWVQMCPHCCNSMASNAEIFGNSAGNIGNCILFWQSSYQKGISHVVILWNCFTVKT